MRNVGNNLFAYALATVVAACAGQPARAYTGPLLTCEPTTVQSATVNFSPGVNCTESPQRITSSVLLDGCGSTVPYPTWDLWAANRYGSRIQGFNADNIVKASVSLKGSMFGSCNFPGSATSAAPSVAGKLTLYNAAGNRLSGGYGHFFARFLERIEFYPLSVDAYGIMTKGFGTGAKINIRIDIDVSSPDNTEILSCNSDPENCELYVEAFETTLRLQTGTASYLEIYFGGEDDCTGGGVPFKCCTGAGTGPTCQGS